jgi:hypothetical protein
MKILAFLLALPVIGFVLARILGKAITDVDYDD